MSANLVAASKYAFGFEIEAHGCDALADLGVIPKMQRPRQFGKKAGRLS